MKAKRKLTAGKMMLLMNEYEGYINKLYSTKYARKLLINLQPAIKAAQCGHVSVIIFPGIKITIEPNNSIKGE